MSIELERNIPDEITRWELIVLAVQVIFVVGVFLPWLVGCIQIVRWVLR